MITYFNLTNMDHHKHFSHPHTLSFYKSLEGAQLTCTGCNFPCTGTPVYSCRACKFFLHDRCFNASRSLTHPSHPDHPLSLFPSPTYSSGSFICNECNKTGSGLCFCCSNCEFDLHIHCAFNTLNPNPSTPPPNQIKLKSHPNHPLKYLPKPPSASGFRSCDVCGTGCDPNGALYRCDICDYDAHVTCTTLPESVRREDHPHTLSLLYVYPYESFECDVCRGAIAKSNCMYHCSSGCNYGMHVKCVPAKVSEQAPMNEMTFQMEMFKLQSQMRLNQMAFDTMLQSSQKAACGVRY
ncbi:putative chromatin regulator PHD family [Helianthus annuus]|nr:putative chromatin regulator PHD family [Helianthus annuus]